MMELLQGHLGTPQPPACPRHLPAAAPPPASPPPPAPSSRSSPAASPRAERCPVRSRSAHAAASPAAFPWVGAEGPRPPRRGDPRGPAPRQPSDSPPLSLPPRSAHSFPGCSAPGGWPRCLPQPRSGSASSH